MNLAGSTPNRFRGPISLRFSHSGHDVKQALFKAYFTNRRNVSDSEVLADVVAELGLDRDDASHVLRSGERAGAVREKEAFWTSRGVQGVPAMIFERQHLLSGAQGVENYAHKLRQLKTNEAA